VARNLHSVLTGWAPQMWGEVQGYCFGTGIYGTVQPLWLKGPEGRLGTVWARFVLLSSILLFFRFGTLLTRNSLTRPVARK
jgi:hypothetical protein